MRKKLYLILLIVLLFPSLVLAKSKTYVRTESNLRVPSDVAVMNDNINNVLNTPSVDADEKIYDFVDKLTSDEIKTIHNDLMTYIDGTDVDSVIVITDDLGPFSIKDYAYNFYDYNDFGRVGLIFVIYINNQGNPEIFMGKSGPSTSKAFTAYEDSRIVEILKYLYVHFLKDGNYYDACSAYVKIISAYYTQDVGNFKINKSGEVVRAIPWVSIIIISLSISFVTIIVIVTKYLFPEKMIDLTIKNSVNYDTMMVKLESDKILGAGSKT